MADLVSLAVLGPGGYATVVVEYDEATGELLSARSSGRSGLKLTIEADGLKRQVESLKAANPISRGVVLQRNKDGEITTPFRVALES